MNTATPSQWLQLQPLMADEQLFAIFSNASSADPLKAWHASNAGAMPSPIWAGTEYAEWRPVMPYVAVVEEGSSFLDWIAQTPASDWGWLAVSRAPLSAMVEQLCSLTLVRLPSGQSTFFRFWDGRYLLPTLQSAEVDAAQFLPLIDRCWIDGQSLVTGGRALNSERQFPWWTVPLALLKTFSSPSSATRLSNLLQWLSEERPDVFELFSEPVLRCKLQHFLQNPALPDAPKNRCVDYLLAECR